MCWRSTQFFRACLFHCRCDGCGHRSHLFGLHRKMLAKEVHVGLAVDGHKMDMGVGNFQSHHSHSHALAGDSLLYGSGYLLGK